jgi:hypothetical protein
VAPGHRHQHAKLIATPCRATAALAISCRTDGRLFFCKDHPGNPGRHLRIDVIFNRQFSCWIYFNFAISDTSMPPTRPTSQIFTRSTSTNTTGYIGFRGRLCPAVTIDMIEVRLDGVMIDTHYDDGADRVCKSARPPRSP